MRVLRRRASPLPSLDDEAPRKMGEMREQSEQIRGRQRVPEPISYGSPRVEKVLSSADFEHEILYAGANGSADLDAGG